MSSNLKVNNILPSTGTTVAVSGIASVTSSVSIASSCTATTFYGSGANLTNLPAQATIANNADNRIITGGSGVNLNAESNVLYDGTNFGINKSPSRTLDVGGKIRSSDSVCFGDNSSTPSEGAAIHRPANSALAFVTADAERVRITSGGLIGIATHSPSAAWVDIASDSGSYEHIRLRRLSSDSNIASNWSIKPYAGSLFFRTSGPADKIQFTQGGNLHIHDGNLVVASGHGIDFSATADGASGSYLNSEVLADYERGRFEPRFLENGTTDSNYAWRYGQYVKIGNIVHVHMAFGISSLSGNFTTAFIGGLPFSMSSQWGTNDFSYVQLIGYSYASGYGDSGNTTQISMELNQTHGTMHRVVQGQGKNNVNQSSIGGSQRFAFQFSYPTAS